MRKTAGRRAEPSALEPAGVETRARASATRQNILDTAARLFRNEGYSAVSMRHIAAAAGMQAGSLYYHFDAKDQIVAEVLRIGVEQVFSAVKAAVDALPADGDPSVAVGLGVQTHLTVLLRLQDYTSANIRIFGQVPRSVREAHLALRDQYEAYWAGLIARCLPGRSAAVSLRRRTARFFLIGAMNNALEWYRDEGASIERIAAEMTHLLLHGLQGRSADGG